MTDHERTERVTYDVTTTPGNPPGAGRADGLTDEVTVVLPAEGAYLAVLRMVTGGLAARLDFTLDEIEDLKIAVDEACAMLLAAALPGGDLSVTFVLQTDVLHVAVTVSTLEGREPSRESFSWTVLTALAGEVDASVDIEDRVTVRLHKRRGVSSV